MKMMNLYLLSLFVLTSCGNTNSTTQNSDTQTPPIEATTTPQTSPQATETTAEASKPKAPQNNMIVGEFQKKDLQEGAYASWFNSGYDEYTPSREAIETIGNNISDYEIVAFMGTWCPDSRREVPQFFKILDEANYDLSNLTIVGVDRTKTTPDGLQEGHDIERVPTFIFYKDGQEVNRYVEYARKGLAEDVAAIVSGKDYKNSYAQ